MNLYKIAMVNTTKEAFPRFHVLETGKLYSREDAIARAYRMNKYCTEELKALDYTKFVPYSVFSE
jgi:hypothetical protein